MLSLSMTEYNKIIIENHELKNKILILSVNERNIDNSTTSRIQTIEELKKENEILKKRIKVLEDNNIKLQKKTESQDQQIKVLTKDNIELKKEIVVLKKDNIELKKEIVVLTKDNIELKKEIVVLKKDNIELKKDNIELKKEIVELKNEIVELKNINATREAKCIYNKFIIAIQDLNRLDNIETRIDIGTANKLKRLRNQRVNECHYLDASDNINLTNDKRMVLYEKIQNMSSEIKKLFDTKYPKLLENILPYIVVQKTEPSEESMEEIDEWWF